MLRCPGCRTRRKDPSLLLRHIQQSGHKACTCGGYWYPHRPGSPCCESNPMSDVHVAMRRGDCTDEELREIEVDCAYEKAGRPFRKWRD